MNIKTISALVLAGVCSVSVSSLSAANFSYTYAEGGVGDYIDDADDPTILVGGSYNIAPTFNLLADWSTTTLASQGLVDLDYDTFSVGVGYHSPMNDSTDVIATVKYLGADISVTNGINSQEVLDGSGFSVGAGLRHKVADNFEANVGLDYIDFEDDDDTIFSVGARYYINQKFSAGLSYQTGEADGVAGTIRYDF